MSSRWNEPSGYASAAYLAALGGQGRPLGETGGWLIERPIAGSDLTDLAGPYPIFTCQNWQALPKAVAGLSPGPVSLTLVSDPFCPLGAAGLAAIFPVCRKLHDHWLIALDLPLAPSKHHRRKLRQAPPVRIEAGPARTDLSADWARLYGELVAKKGIRDARAFSQESLTAQLAVPGAHLVTAWQDGALIGADLYYLDRGRAFAHLSAYAEAGYALSVSYPMMTAAVDYFRPLAEVIDLGGAAAGAAGAGMAHFKAGWASLTLPSHLCGKVLDEAAYRALGGRMEGFFPSYRAGEFGG